MNNPVLILYLEDNPQDVKLAQDRLQQIEMVYELQVARDRVEYEAALAQTRFDLILSAYNLPDFNGMAALALARSKQPDVPFILISGVLGEEQALDCVLRGATDYVLKQQLSRLTPAVFRALAEAEEHRKRREAEKLLRNSEIRYRRLFETAKDGILILNAETGMIVDVNPFLIELLGFSREAFLGKKIWEIGFFKDAIANERNFVELRRTEYIRYEDLPLETADGRRIDVEFVSNVYMEGDHKVIQCNIRDITRRSQMEATLRESEECAQRESTKLAAMISGMEEGIAFADADNVIVEVNDFLCRLVGRQRSEILGKRIEDFHQGKVLESILAPHRRFSPERELQSVRPPAAARQLRTSFSACSPSTGTASTTACC